MQLAKSISFTIEAVQDLKSSHCLQNGSKEHKVNDKAIEYCSHSVTSTIFSLHKERHFSGNYQTYTKSYHLMLTS